MVLMSQTQQPVVVQQPIECVAVPLQRAKVEEPSRVGTWVIVGFLLVLCLKIIGLLLIAAWMVRKFPKTVFAAATAIPIFGYLRRSRLTEQQRQQVRD
jgi:hypothetical protein